MNSLGTSIDLTNTATAPFFLQAFDTSSNVNIYNSKGMKQDGANYLDNTLDIRDISLKIVVTGTSEDELINYKWKINNVFNPKNGEGWLIYKNGIRDKKIKCIVNKLPYFSPINAVMCNCLINLTANNPYWQELQEIRDDIAAWLGNFEFELEIPEDTGIELGHREPSLIVNVFNSGDVECGMRIVFKALASLSNPSLLNVNTKEYIKINKDMVAGEIITIMTQFNNKKIIDKLNGVETNALMYIDLGSTFLQLAVGDNLFRYNADEGLDNLECSIYYTPQYLGV